MSIVLFVLSACTTENQPALYEGDPIGRISGVVLDVAGEPVPDVTVTVEGLTAVTAVDGTYTIDAVEPADLLVVEFKNPGFAKNYKRTQLISWETVPVNAVMTPIDGFDVIDSSLGGLVNIADVKIDFAADGFVDSSGNPYDGEVRVEVTYLDPYSDDMKYAPGDLTALAFDPDVPYGAKEATAPAQLVSYGMVDVSLYANDTDEDVQLADDAPAAVSMPVTNGDLPSVYHLTDGQEQTLWYFDTAKGIWSEEGEGSVVPEMADIIDDDPESETYGEVIGQEATGGLAFEFEAAHFSWYNCDQGFVPSCAVGKVVDVLGFPVRSARVDAVGGQSSSSVYTDEDGYYVATVLVGDTVSFSGTTRLSEKDWVGSQDNVYLYGYGSSAAECQPIPDIEIPVCRESGIVMADNLQIYASGLEAGQNADQVRAWFWEPSGDPWLCENPWDEIAVDTCRLESADEYPDQFRPRDIGIANETHSAGEWLDMRTPRDTYHMEERDLNGNPVYWYETLELSNDESTTVIVNDVDLRDGDTIWGRAPGSLDNYFGPMPTTEWMTLQDAPIITNLPLDGALPTMARNGGFNVRYQAQNNEDYMLVMVTGGPDEDGLLCKYADDGSIDISGADMGEMSTGWTSISVYRPEIGWTTGPNGMPIRVQGLSGSIFETELR